MQVFPNYYDKFKCISSECKHNCCIGWEIDIDEETMEYYNSLDGELGERIKNCVSGDVPYFVLSEGERCPFLNSEGLCDIISELGEDALCDICYLHPRFSNFYDEFTETGLGICCEEAARIILTDKEKFSVQLPPCAANDEFFKERQKVFDILQNRNISVLERFKKLAEEYRLKFSFSNKAVYDFYMSLERLDKSWEDELEKIVDSESDAVFEREDLQIFFEQLACYFIFRHYREGIGFTLLSCWVIGKICSDLQETDEILDVARQYSSEIEYCEENTKKLQEFFSGIM